MAYNSYNGAPAHAYANTAPRHSYPNTITPRHSYNAAPRQSYSNGTTRPSYTNQKPVRPIFATTDFTASQHPSSEGYYTSSLATPPVVEQQPTPPVQTIQFTNVMPNARTQNADQRGIKRKFPGKPPGPRQHFKKQIRLDLTVPQNPVSLLGILQPKITYSIKGIVEGQPRSGFKCSVRVDGKEFIVDALNKKVAKGACAEAVLLHFINLPGSAVYTELEKRMREGHPNIPVTRQGMISTFYSIQEKERERQENKTALSFKPESHKNTNDLETRHPVSVLNEKSRGNYTFDLSWEKIANGHMVHTAKLMINGNTYECKGGDKKSVKSQAALQALATEYNITAEVLKQPKLLQSKKKKGKGGSKENLKALAMDNPIMVVNQLVGADKICVVKAEETDSSQPASFLASANIEGKSYTTKGSNKKKVKVDLARLILKEHYEINTLDGATPTAT